jgi:hypothetical protein
MKKAAHQSEIMQGNIFNVLVNNKIHPDYGKVYRIEVDGCYYSNSLRCYVVTETPGGIEIPVSDLIPIPLSEKILSDLSFVRMKGFIFEKELESRGLTRIEIIEWTTEGYLVRGISQYPIYFLHQLQNLYKFSKGKKLPMQKLVDL